MEQLALDYRKQVDALFVREQDKEELYEWLQRYNDMSLGITKLVANIRSIVNHPDQLVLFDHSRCLIRHEDQKEYEAAIPRFSQTNTKSVLLSTSNNEKIGLSVRGGLEHKTGIFVVDVERGSAADRCGISTGDEILIVNGYNVKFCTHKEAINLISRHKAMLALKVRHAGMIPVPVVNSNEFHWVFADHIRGEDNGVSSNDERVSPSYAGNSARKDNKMVLVETDGHPALGFNVVDTKSGVYVSYVKRQSPADAAGVIAGDEILEVNDLKLRKATTPEIIYALKQPGKLRMVLRPSPGFHSKATSSVSISFCGPTIEESKDSIPIEEKIDGLLEAKLAKRAEELRNGDIEKRRGMLIAQDNDSQHVKSTTSSAMYTLPPPPPPPPPPQRAPPPPLPQIPPPPPPPLPQLSPIKVDADIHHPSSSGVESESLADFPPLLPDLASQIDAESKSLPATSGRLTQQLAPSWTLDRGNIKEDSKEVLKDHSSDINTDRNTYWKEKLRNIGHRRQQKLEAELRERLKIERQKRLVQERSLRLDRIRQELKEEEREEARLQKLLAEPEYNEEIHHTVGRYGYPTTTAGIVTGVPSSEFTLTTPLNMVNRTRTQGENTEGRHTMLTTSNNERLSTSAYSMRGFEISYEKEIDGKRIVISETNKKVQNAGKVSRDGEISRYASRGGGVRMTPTETIVPRFNQSSRSYARVNSVNEITFF